MHYYKVIKNDRVIDVLDKLIYLKYLPKRKIMVLSDINEAQAILSSDKNTIWHEPSLYRIPAEAGDYDVVKLIEIDKYEFDQLSMLNLKSPEEIADAVILSLIRDGII